MRVTVKLFANLKETAGAGELALDVDGHDVTSVVEKLIEVHPSLEAEIGSGGSLRPSLRVLVNGELCDVEDGVREGDEVALLPPVSGGTQDRLTSRHLRDVTSTTRRMSEASSR